MKVSGRTVVSTVFVNQFPSAESRAKTQAMKDAPKSNGARERYKTVQYVYDRTPNIPAVLQALMDNDKSGRITGKSENAPVPPGQQKFFLPSRWLSIKAIKDQAKISTQADQKALLDARQAVRDAEKEVSDAQRAYDSHLGAISQKEDQITRLQGFIDSYQASYDRKPRQNTLNKINRYTQDKQTAQTELTALRSQTATLSNAVTTAQSRLSTAQTTLAGLE